MNCFYKGNGDVFVFGCNNVGQLGLGDYKSRDKPTLLMNDKTIKNIILGENHSIIYKDNGDVFVFGCNDVGQLGLGDYENRNKPTLLMQEKQPTGNDKTIKNIASGRYHSIIYKDNGDVLVFGSNNLDNLVWVITRVEINQHY